MGEPNPACFDKNPNYLTWTTTTSSTTVAPGEEDFFVLPTSGVVCPSIVFDAEDNAWFDPVIDLTEKLQFVCLSDFYDPNFCVLEVDKYIRVADLNIQTDRCRRYRLRIKDLSVPTTTPAPTITTPGPTTTLAPSVVGNSANYNLQAVWGGVANVTTVGSNGGPSAYGTYDQTGNITEWNDVRLQGGVWSVTNTSIISTNSTWSYAPESKSGTFGLRLASSSNPNSLPNFVTIGDIGNNSDTNRFGPIGSVNYSYKISRYPVTNCDYVVFLNAIAAIDTYNLYLSSQINSLYYGITRNGSSGSYTYTVKTNMGNKPVVWIDWFDAARYCNWLHNNKPSGVQNSGTTEDGAYTLNGVVFGSTIAKNINAKYHIPTRDEWYKAAYYKRGSANAGYWLYATQSNVIPTPVTASSIGDGLINGFPARTPDYTCP